MRIAAQLNLEGINFGRRGRDQPLPSVRTVTGEACSRLRVRELRLRVEAEAGEALHGLALSAADSIATSRNSE